MYFRRFHILVLAAFLLAGGLRADDPAPEPTAEPEEGQPAVVEAKLETFYVPDKDGNMVPFFKTFPFEKLEQLYRLQKRFEQPEKPDRFSVPRLIATAKQQKNAVQIDFTIQVRTHSDDWVRAPLRLGQCALSENPKIEGPGEYYLNVAKDGVGYDLWAKAPENSVISVGLKTIAPLSVRGSVHTMQLSVPTAASSQLNFTPGGGVVDLLRVEGGVTSRGNQKTIEFIGLGGEFLAEFSPRVNQPTQQLPAIMEASSTTRALFEGSHHIRSDVALRVHSLSTPLDSFLVRLPDGMLWVPREAQSGRSLYTIEALTDDEIKQANLPSRFRQAKLVRVQLARKTTEPVDIEIRAVVDREQSSQNELVEVAGFEVVGAAQQWGAIDLAAAGEWSIETKGKNVQRVDQIPARVRQQGVIQRFEFSSQPCSLKVGVKPRPPRISVEPAYTLSIERGIATLEARLVYNVRGATELKIDMPGWTVASVQPESAVEADQLNLASVTPLAILLASLSQQELRNLEIVVTATAPLKEDGSFALTLPKPHATTVSPALVALKPAADVLLKLDPEKLIGLTAEPIPAIPTSPLADGSMLYRTRGQEITVSLAGRVEERPRRIGITQDATIHTSSEGVDVQQQFVVQIEHQPLAQLRFSVPEALLQNAGLRFTHREQELQWSDVEETESTEEQPAEERQIVIDLQGERRGAFPVVASWRSDYSFEPEEGQSDEFKLNLVQVASGFADHDDGARVTVFTDSRLRVSRIEGDWETIDASDVFTASRDASPAEIHLYFSRSEPLAGGVGVTVQRAWLQSWISSGRRRNRAVFQLSTPKDSVLIQLQEQPIPDSVQVAVDGVRLDSLANMKGNELVTPLSAFNQAPTHTIEVWYTVDESAFRWGLVTVRPPRIEGAGSPQRFYWQVATSAQQQLISAPKPMDDELRWQWRGLYFQRSAELTQQDLENWSGATAQVELPSSSNQYLFGSFETPEEISARFASRWLLAAAAAIGALLCAVLIYRAPMLRSPGMLLALAAVLAAVVYSSPTLAMTIGQWAVWGVAAFIVVQAVDWVVLRRRTPVRVASAIDRSDEDLPSTTDEPNPGGFDFSTATAPHLRQNPESTRSEAM